MFKIPRMCGASLLSAGLLGLAACDSGPTTPVNVATFAPTSAHRPVLPSGAAPYVASFIDPTVRIDRPENVTIAERTYIAPFVTITATSRISIGEGSNVQDNVAIIANANGEVKIGDQCIVMHGATIIGPAKLGAIHGQPMFIGFNAVVDGATVEGDAMVGILARVAPGVIIRSGTRVLHGKFIQTQAEADDAALGKVTAVTPADRVFMNGVLEVNENLARGYAALYFNSFEAVLGINQDPAQSEFNPARNTPKLAGAPAILSAFRNRIIGFVEMANTAAELNLVMGNMDAIRADEGEPFMIGTIAKMEDQVTFHALERSGITTGNGVLYGFHAVVHGGADAGNAPPITTVIGDSVHIKEWSVVFRSTLGKGCIIGAKALVDGSQLPAGTVVPDRAIIVDNVIVGTTEW